MSKMSRRRKRRQAEARIRGLSKGKMPEAKDRKVHVHDMRTRNGQGFHSSQKGGKGYKRHPKHKGRDNQ